MVEAGFLGAMAALALGGAIFGTGSAVRWWLTRRRIDRWGREWELVGPKWGHKMAWPAASANGAEYPTTAAGPPSRAPTIVWLRGVAAGDCPIVSRQREGGSSVLARDRTFLASPCDG